MGKREIWMENKEMKGGVFKECLLMNIFLPGCPHGQGGGGSAKSRQLQAGGEGRGEGGQKSIKMYRHSLWMAPKITMFDPLILTELMKGKPPTLSNVFKVRFLLRHA